jgi:RNA polymerase III subunit RPC82
MKEDGMIVIAKEKEDTPPTQKNLVLDFEEVSNKKQKTSKYSMVVPATHTFVVNFERYHIERRNDDISELASKCVNKSAGNVMRSFFDMLMPSMLTITEVNSRILF